MRIGIDASVLSKKNLTGIGFYVYNALAYMAKNNQHDRFILYSHEPIQHHVPNSGNIEEKIVFGGPLTKRITTIWLRLYLGRQIATDKLDVFWGPQHILPSKVDGVRYVLTINDLALLICPSWGKFSNSLVQNLFVKTSAKRADQIIAISNATKNDIMRLFHIPSEKIQVVLLAGAHKPMQPVETNGLKVVREKFSISDHFLLYVGTIEPRKNIENIVKAFDLVADQDHHIELVLAGGLGWRYGDILDTIEKSKHKNRIHQLGYVTNEEKAGLLSGAKAFLFPSHYEGFGIPVLEALEQGTPVITASNSSLIEVAGKAAFYVKDENNVTELAEMMLQAMQMSPEERNNRIRAGYEHAEKFSWEKCARETTKLLTGE